jgi:hypothetical protein
LLLTPDVWRRPDEEKANVFSAFATGGEWLASDAGHVVRARVVGVVTYRIDARLFYVFARLETARSIDVDFGLHRPSWDRFSLFYSFCRGKPASRQEMTEV